MTFSPLDCWFKCGLLLLFNLNKTCLFRHWKLSIHFQDFVINNTNSKINRCIKMFAKLIINLYIGIIIKNLVFFSLLIRLRLKYTNQAITKLWPYQNWRFCFGNFSYILRECSLKSSSNIGREVEISPFS